MAMVTGSSTEAVLRTAPGTKKKHIKLEWLPMVMFWNKIIFSGKAVSIPLVWSTLKSRLLPQLSSD